MSEKNDPSASDASSDAPARGPASDAPRAAEHDASQAPAAACVDEEPPHRTDEARPPPRDPAAPPAVRRDLRHLWILLALVALTIVVRVATLPMIEMGGDAVKAWFNAKMIVLGIAGRYWEWDHHAVRFAIILPTALIQLVFGLSPRVYYAFPIAMAVLQVALLYAIGRQLRAPVVGFAAGIAMALHPQLERTAGQILSEVPSAVAALLGVYILLRYRDDPRHRVRWAVVLGVSLFVFGWMTKLTNVLFVPGFAIGLWAYGRRWRHVLLLGGVMLGLFVVETLVYRTVLDFPLGQLSVVRKTHLSHKLLQPIEAHEFFTHVTKLPGIWQLTLAAFGAAMIAAVVLRRRIGSDPLLVGLVPATFLLIQNFAVKSIHPLQPVQRFLSRYMEPALPLLVFVTFWVVALGVRAALQRTSRASTPLPRWAGLAAAGAVTVAVCGWAVFDRWPAKGKHPFEVLAAYENKSNPAFARGVPVVGFERNEKDVDFFLKILWDGLRSRAKLADMPRIRSARFGKDRAYFTLHPKHEAAYVGERDPAILEKWKGKEVVIVGRHPQPGKNMGFAFDLKTAKLRAP